MVTLEHIVFFAGGAYVVITTLKIMALDNALKKLSKQIPTADDIAKAILKMKLPVKDIPKEVLDEFNKQKKDTEKTSDNIKTYTG